MPARRLVRLFGHVRPGEGLVALVLCCNVFLILSGYYVLKTVREGLILTGGMLGLGGDELKIYASAGAALLLVGVVPAYGTLASRVSRIRLINTCYVAIVISLAAFFALGRAGVPVGLAFFLWLSIVNVFLIAQFWSYANDLYTEEQGKRLFAIIALGGSAGAIAGPRIAQLGTTFTMMLLAAAMLGTCVVLYNLADRFARARAPRQAALAAQPVGRAGGFRLVLRDRYLALIALMLIVANLVNTTGEFILADAVDAHAVAVHPGADAVDARRELIKNFYGDFFFWVNLVAFAIQAFLVSRVLRYAGVRVALFVLPAIALVGYGAIGLVGGLALIRIAKIAENSTDYSLQNTARQALFLPTTREAKYKAKAAIDTFFVRIGDTLAAVVVAVGLHGLGLGARQLALVNVGLAVVWLAVVASIAVRHRRLAGEPPAEAGAMTPAPAPA
jgi:ATP:ADP antiporter, AAA family